MREMITVISLSLRGQEKKHLEDILPRGKWLLVSDENTHAALGKRILSLLSNDVHHHLLEDDVKADMATSFAIAKQAERLEAIIAVGSGTINDLCKYAAHALNIPYVVFPTAPSMNGYVSPNASLYKDGVKLTLAATAPCAVLCDLEVLAASPARLIRSGLGDSLCRPTAQVDWLLSHLLLSTTYSDTPFHLLTCYESALLANASKLTSGDIGSIELLMRTLLASGEGMRVAGGSYPASQGEHMIAHTMDMLFGGSLANTHHGEQIGITTLTMARLQASILTSLKPPQVRIVADPFVILAGHMKRSMAKSMADIYQNKRRQVGCVDVINARMSEAWPDMRERLSAVTLPAELLEEALKEAGAPTTPSEIGWKNEQYTLACKLAALTRDRFTFLDLFDA